MNLWRLRTVLHLEGVSLGQFPSVGLRPQRCTRTDRATLPWGFLWATHTSQTAQLYFHSNWKFEGRSKYMSMKRKSGKELTCEPSHSSPFRKILWRRKSTYNDSSDWLGMKKETCFKCAVKYAKNPLGLRNGAPSTKRGDSGWGACGPSFVSPDFTGWLLSLHSLHSGERH